MCPISDATVTGPPKNPRGRPPQTSGPVDSTCSSVYVARLSDYGFAASVARCREYRAAPQLNASGLLDHTLIA